MKFILLIEEQGYQVRYWDEITNNIGECIAESWDNSVLHQDLQVKGFNINKKELDKAIEIIEEKSFVVLSSHHINESDIDTFINSVFTIDEEC